MVQEGKITQLQPVLLSKAPSLSKMENNEHENVVQVSRQAGTKPIMAKDVHDMLSNFLDGVPAC